MSTMYDEKKLFTTARLPWMKLGEVLEDAVTAEEAAARTGMNFDVQLLPVEYTHNGRHMTWDKRQISVRSDNGHPLGVVSAKYEPVQYAQAFAFMDAISPRYEAAGLLQGGRQGFMVVTLPDVSPLQVLGGDDEHRLYVTLRTSHDRSRGVELTVMPLRGLCMNMLSLKTFGSKATNRWSFKHTTSVHAKMKEAQETLARTVEYRDEFQRIVERLHDVDVAADWAYEMLVTHVLPKTAKKNEEVADHIIHMWQTDETIGAIGRDNGWGVINAVSSYYQHERVGGTPESRFLGALQGTTYKAVNTMATLVLTRG